MDNNEPVKKRPPWRPRKFESPEQYFEMFLKYKSDCEKNPITTTQINHKGEKTDLEIPQPLTKEGFSVFCNGTIQTVFYDTKKHSDDFSAVVTRVENEINSQLIKRAIAGQFKENLVKAYCGLVDKQEVTNTIKTKFVLRYEEGEDD